MRQSKVNNKENINATTGVLLPLYCGTNNLRNSPAQQKHENLIFKAFVYGTRIPKSN